MFGWTRRRTAAVATTTLLVTALGAGTAWAADAPTPRVTTTVNGNQVTITTDLATVQALCARVGAAETRLSSLIDRIQGDATTPGSVAYLQARARQASSAGHGDLATRLDARAARRGDRVPDLQRAMDRLRTADSSVCAALPAAGQ